MHSACDGRCVNYVLPDYILHTPGQLETLRTLAVPGEAALGEDRLPSAQFCSDHISLVADISLISYVN